MTFYITLGIAAFLFVLLGTRIFILAVRDRQIFPANAHSKHIARTPGGGGIVIVFTLIICLAQVDFNYSSIFSMLMLAAISLLADQISIPRISKIFAQAIAVSIPLSAMDASVLPHFIPIWLSKTLIGILWIWFINLFKFMDLN
ncbi:MAG: hypothetical protein EB121_03770, partial [Alphaproteobacteria bacterium]|nr:hypothetical protein [Alphaproteobacteria bacterium]